MELREAEIIDPAHVLEKAMRHFFYRALRGKDVGREQKEIDGDFKEAAMYAGMLAPYRHHRLGAIKLSADPVDPGLRENASQEELQAEIMKHFQRLAPVLDLEALLGPRPVTG